MINNGITPNNMGQSAPCQLSFAENADLTRHWDGEANGITVDEISQVDLFFFFKMPTYVAHWPSMQVFLMTQDESKDLGKSSQSEPQQLVKANPILEGNPFLWKRFQTAWGGLTALAGINSSRKISLLFLVMSPTLAKLTALWPCELKEFLHCFKLMIFPLRLWPRLIPFTFLQPPCQSPNPPTCSGPGVFAMDLSLPSSGWNALLQIFARLSLFLACECIQNTTLSSISLFLFYFSP